MAGLRESVKQHLQFGRRDVAALAGCVALLLNTVVGGTTYRQYNTAGCVASSVQMLREPLMAIALAACRGLLADGYVIRDVFA